MFAVSDLKSNRFATGSADFTIKIWSSTNNQLLKTLQGHTGQLKSLVKLENENMLASGSSDFAIKVWDLVEYTLVKNLTGHTGSVNCLINVGKMLASGSSDGLIKIWNVTTGLNLFSIKTIKCKALKKQI